MNEFHEGDAVLIAPWTFHNQSNEPRTAEFVRYMAGFRYAIVVPEDADGRYDARVQVKDIYRAP